MNMLTQLNGLLQSNDGSMADLNSYTLGQAQPDAETLGFLFIIAVVIITVALIAYLGLPV